MKIIQKGMMIMVTMTINKNDWSKKEKKDDLHQGH